ncbi:MAG: hypothetical protein ACOYJY_07390 [Acutalibacteraceae bacterium]|jgi:hypothetical protein
MPDRPSLWNVFTQTGRVADYLRYRGIDPAEETATQEAVEHEGDDRRPDYSGKQQYR